MGIVYRFSKVFSFFGLIFLLAASCSKKEEEDNNSNPVDQPEICERIYEGDIVNPSIEELQMFFDSGYCEVRGRVFINNDEITDLSLLSNLDYVSGNFYISECANLISLEGSQDLDSVGGSFGITNNNQLIEMDNAFESLRAVSDSFKIESNTLLRTIDGFRALKKIDGKLVISGLEVRAIRGFSNLKKVSNFFSVQAKKLSELNAFRDLELVGADFGIVKSDSLRAINNFNALKSVGGNFIIELNLGLNLIDGFKNLEYVGDTLKISNANLVSIDGFNSLESIYMVLEVIDNNALTDLDWVSNLSFVGQDIRIMYNTSLHDLCGLKYIITNGIVGDNIIIFENGFNPSPVTIASGNCSN